jgi:hypothetical protein
MAPQMVTISECRWLRLPATKLVKNHCNLHRLLGFVFGGGIDPNNVNDLACRFKSPRNHIHNLIRTKISRAVGSFAESIFHNIRSANSSSATVLLFAMFESKTEPA